MIQAPKDGATYFCWAMALVYSVTFGSTLIIAPKFFWGPDSMFCYWEVNDESGVFFGRILGILMCSATPREPRSSSRQRGRCRCRNAGPHHLGRGRLGSTRDSGTTSVDARSVIHAWCSCCCTCTST